MVVSGRVIRINITPLKKKNLQVQYKLKHSMCKNFLGYTLLKKKKIQVNASSTSYYRILVNHTWISVISWYYNYISKKLIYS